MSCECSCRFVSCERRVDLIRRQDQHERLVHELQRSHAERWPFPVIPVTSSALDANSIPALFTVNGQVDIVHFRAHAHAATRCGDRRGAQTSRAKDREPRTTGRTHTGRQPRSDCWSAFCFQTKIEDFKMVLSFDSVFTRETANFPKWTLAGLLMPSHSFQFNMLEYGNHGLKQVSNMNSWQVLQILRLIKSKSPTCTRSSAASLSLKNDPTSASPPATPTATQVVTER